MRIQFITAPSFIITLAGIVWDF